MMIFKHTIYATLGLLLQYYVQCDRKCSRQLQIAQWQPMHRLPGLLEWLSRGYGWTHNLQQVETLVLHCFWCPRTNRDGIGTFVKEWGWYNIAFHKRTWLTSSSLPTCTSSSWITDKSKSFTNVYREPPVAGGSVQTSLTEYHRQWFADIFGCWPMCRQWWFPGLTQSDLKGDLILFTVYTVHVFL